MPDSFSSVGPVSNYIYHPPSRTFQEHYSGRVDHQFNPNFKIYGSYTYNPATAYNVLPAFPARIRSLTAPRATTRAFHNLEFVDSCGFKDISSLHIRER